MIEQEDRVRIPSDLVLEPFSAAGCRCHAVVDVSRSPMPAVGRRQCAPEGVSAHQMTQVSAPEGIRARTRGRQRAPDGIRARTSERTRRRTGARLQSHGSLRLSESYGSPERRLSESELDACYPSQTACV